MDRTADRKARARAVSTLALAGALLFGPRWVHAQGSPAPGTNQAFLYEMSEDAVLTNYLGHLLAPDPTGTSPTGLIDAVTLATRIPDVVPAARSAVSSLQGYASYPSPLCPLTALVTNPKSDTCTITVTGYDSVALLNGSQPVGGPVWGTLNVVIQLDNAVDSPEWPLVPGVFSGSISFGQANVPIGAATGSMIIGATLPSSVPANDPAAVAAWVAGMCKVAPTTCFPFTAKFRQPFSASTSAKHPKPRRGEAAFYLLDNGKKQQVRDDERATGWPTVRFEVNF